MLAFAAMFLAMRIGRLMSLHPATTLAVAALLVIPAILWSSHLIVSRFTELHAVLGNALAAFRDGDFSLRLSARGDRELADLKQLYNELADTVRADRRELHEKEILLDTILQRTPVAVVLLNAADRVIYSNGAARDLLTGGARLNDRLLPELDIPPTLQEALAGDGDSIFNYEDEMFHLSRRVFHLNTQRHRLLLIERLTPELRRQEVGIWKKAIRVINHEINNTVAPISSLFHSLRRAQSMPEHQHRQEEIYALLEERMAFLRHFLDAYAEFARLPEPHKERTSWREIVEAVRALYEFQVEGSTGVESDIDRAQMEQVLINLIKNAHESGSEPGAIVMSLQRAGSEIVLRVIDRGRGMSDEVMRQAVLPFFSTKPGGSGVGLALCNEIVQAHGGRMRLQARDGGGTVVTCWLPV